VLDGSIVAALHSGWTRCATRAPGHLTQPPGKTAITSRGAQLGRSDGKISCDQNRDLLDADGIGH